MVTNECAKVAGLQRLMHEFIDGEVVYYWGHTAANYRFTVLARERGDAHVVTFFTKPWTLSRGEPVLPEKKKVKEITSVNLRLDTIVNRINGMEQKMDRAICAAKTSRDLLSQRYDSLLSRLLKREEQLPPGRHRLDNVVGDVRALEDKVAGLSQKTHDAGRTLSNPPSRTLCGPPSKWCDTPWSR